MAHSKKVKLATFLYLLSINNSFALGIFFDKKETESIPEEEPSSYLSTPYIPNEIHTSPQQPIEIDAPTQQPRETHTTTQRAVETPTSNQAPSQEHLSSMIAPVSLDKNLKKLNYNGAISYSQGLSQKVGNTSQMTFCAKGVRWLVNTLFGRATDAHYTQSAALACELGETALNSGGLGSSSGKGFRYREVPANSYQGSIPEGSIITCANKQNPGCLKKGGITNAGHAEMFLGGRFVSGANDSASAACTGRNSNGQPSFTNIKIFVLEKT